MTLNIKGGAAIAFRCQGDPAGKLLQWREKKRILPLIPLYFCIFFNQPSVNVSRISHQRCPLCAGFSSNRRGPRRRGQQGPNLERFSTPKVPAFAIFLGPGILPSLKKIG